MDDEVESLAKQIAEQYRQLSKDKRLLVSVAGIPGSGKSTLAYPLTDKINSILLQHPPTHPSHATDSTGVIAPDEHLGEGDEVAICVGLDGWHYSRADLDRFKDPKEAHWLRGAAFTFNLPSYLTFLQQLRLPLSPNPPLNIPFPTFDHALKDPLPSQTTITPQHRIIIIEGLYCLLSLPGWKEAAEMFDVRVWVECEYETARRRVIKRNFEAGIVDDLDRCAERVDAVDMQNAKQILANRIEATHTITPLDKA